jgi:DNA-binding winged helix-turn-helix (wHTH) protein
MGSNQMPEGKPPKQTRFDQLTRVYTLRNEIEKNIKRGVVIEPHRVISLTSAEFRLLEALLNQFKMEM